jgi:hypothetical protein
MQLTAIQLRNQARFKANFQDTTALTNAEVLIQLNEGYSKLIAAIVDVDQDYYEEQRASFDLVANCSLVSLPTDCIKVKQVRLAYSTPSNQDDYKIADFYDPSDTIDISIDETNVPVSNPIVDITNNYCRVYPKPTVAVTAGGQYFYIARPSALVNTGDTLVMPNEYQDLVAVYAASKIAERFNDYSRSDRLKAEFGEGLAKMKSELSGREMNRQFRFKNVSEVPKSRRYELPN